MELLNRRREMGSHLPYDAEIEYLESTGTQYIDTGYQVIYNSSVVMEQQATIAYTVTNVRQLNGSNGFGYWGCTANNRFEGTNPSYISVGTGYHYISFSYKRANNRAYTTLYIDNVKAVESDYSIENSEAYDIFIYAIGGRNHAAASFFSKAKIKSYKLLFDGEVVLDLIPVRVGQVGYMYDKISKQLFGNAGTGAFILGSDKGAKNININVKTHTIGSSDASLDVTTRDGEPVNLLFTTVMDTPWTNEYIQIGYKVGSGWKILALTPCLYDGQVYQVGDLIETWNYRETKDITIIANI